MSDVAATLEVVVAGRDTATAMLTRLEAQLDRSEAAARRLQTSVASIGGNVPRAAPAPASAPPPSGGGGADPATQAGGVVQLQRAQAALEAQQARLARSQGDVARAADLEASAEQRLTGIINAQSATTTQTIAAQRQLVSVQQQVTNASQQKAAALGQVGGVLQQVGSQIGGLTGQVGALAGSLGTLGAVGAAVGLGKAALDLAQTGAQADQTRTRFDQLARQANTTGDAMLASLRSASGGTISDTALELDAMKASLLGVASSADELGPLLAIARDRAQQMGISTEFAFESLVTGLGRGSRLILDNIGVIVKEGAVNEAYAKSVGKTVAQLSDQEKKQALINEVLRQGQASMAATGGAVESTAVSFQRAQAAITNAKEALGGLLALKIGPLAEDVSKLANALSGADSISGGLSGILSINDKLGPLSANINLLKSGVGNLTGITIPDFSVQAQGNAAAWGAFFTTLQQGQGITTALAAAGRANAQAVDAQAAARTQAAAAAQAQAAAEEERAIKSQAAANSAGAQAALTAQVTSAQLGYASSLELAGVQARAAALAAAQKATADAVAAVNAQAAAVAQQTFGQEARAAATALIASGQAGEATAAQLAASSSPVDQLTAAYLRLQIAETANSAATAANAQAISDSAIQSQIDAQAKDLQTLQTQRLNEQAQIMANAFLAANPAINAAGIQAQVTAGAINPLIGKLAELTLQIRQAKVELAGASAGRPETGGDALARSLGGAAANQRFVAEQAERAAEAQRQQVLATGSQSQKIKILSEDYAQAVKLFGKGSAEAIAAETKLIQSQQSGAKGAKGAGAAKLSDQQRLNNQLLTQQGRSNQQFEDAERQHQQRVLDIEAEFQKKSLEQQRANEVSKRQSRADFYDNLTSSTDEVGTAVANRLSASYEEAYAKAQAMAQAGNAKLAAEYLKLKQDQLNADLEFEKNLAEAQKNGDEAEAERLKRIQELRQQAQAEEEKQLLAGGDSNVNQRNQALTEENTKFEEQQNKIGTASDRATDRLVTNAQRAGKAVTDTLIPPLEKAAGLVERVGGSAPTVGAADASGLPASGAPTPPTTPANGGPTDLAGILRAIGDQITAAVATVEAATKDGSRDVAQAVRGLGERFVR